MIDCPHTERRDGVCVACGDCLHEIILNRACFYCGTTDLDPIALSPKKPELIAPSGLVRMMLSSGDPRAHGAINLRRLASAHCTAS